MKGMKDGVVDVLVFGFGGGYGDCGGRVSRGETTGQTRSGGGG